MSTSMDLENPEIEVTSSESGANPQYLTFGVDTSVYGIPIVLVSEIIRSQQSTPVPDARPFMRGVINLRGTVIPVMDVRRRLGLQPMELTNRACIVVVEVEGSIVGLLVDAISEVTHIDPNQIETAPRRRCHQNANIGGIVTGLYQTESEVLIMIDMHELLFGEYDREHEPAIASGTPTSES